MSDSYTPLLKSQDFQMMCRRTERAEALAVIAWDRFQATGSPVWKPRPIPTAVRAVMHRRRKGPWVSKKARRHLKKMHGQRTI